MYKSVDLNVYNVHMLYHHHFLNRIPDPNQINAMNVDQGPHRVGTQQELSVSIKGCRNNLTTVITVRTTPTYLATEISIIAHPPYQRVFTEQIIFIYIHTDFGREHVQQKINHARHRTQL